MTGTNHFLTGVGIATVIKQPLLAIPLAFCSHFLLDILPHYGKDTIKNYKKVWLTDASLLLVSFIYLLITGWSLWAIVAGFAAMSPDTAWLYRFAIKEKWGKLPAGPKNKFNAFHSRIQTREFAKGIWVDAAYFVVLASTLVITKN